MTTTTTMRVGRVWMGLALVAVALAVVSTMAQDLGTKGQGSPIANDNAEHSLFKNPSVPGLKGLIGKLRGKRGESETAEPKKENAGEPKTTEKISTEDAEYDMSVAAAAKDMHHDHPSSESEKPKAAGKKGHRRGKSSSTTEEEVEEVEEVKEDKNGSEAVMFSDAASSASEDLDVTDASKRKRASSAGAAGGDELPTN